jgi:large subunit ribosomal protein L1
MGKTKTAILTGEVTAKKTSAEEYAEKKAKKAAQIDKQSLPLRGENQPKVATVEEVVNKEEVITEAPKEAQEEAPKRVEKEIVEKVRGKKYVESKAKVSKATNYKLEDAVKAVKEATYSKFDGTMELHLVVKKQGTTAQVTLPFSTGKVKKIEIADEKTLAKLKEGKVDFDLLLATADMMPKLAMFARLLGPKGLMPNPKNGTVIKSEKDAEKFKGNLITLKTEREAALIHTSFGKVSQKMKSYLRTQKLF